MKGAVLEENKKEVQATASGKCSKCCTVEDHSCCSHKTKERTEKEYKDLINRLNRIEGQVRGVKNMIENDAYCTDVLIQLSAIENATKSLSNHILENHLYSCVSRDLENGNLDVIDELISLFKKFNK